MSSLTDEENEPTERSPLLARNGQDGRPGSLLPSRPTLKSTRSILLVLGLVVFLSACGDQIVEAPQTRIFESVICYDYYESFDPSRIKLGRDAVGPGAIGGVDEMLCKAEAVQDRLAVLIGYQSFFDGFPYLALAIPFGWVADRYSRWLVLFLNLVQFVLRQIWTQAVVWNWQVFDIRSVWAASALCLLGGGQPMAANVFFVMLADITPEEDRAAAFLRMEAASLSANLFMPPLAAWLMTTNPWIPSLAGIGTMVLAALLFLFIPETMNFRHQLPPSPSQIQIQSVQSPIDSTKSAGEGTVALAKLARRWTSNMWFSLSFMALDWRVPGLISTFFMQMLIAGTTRLILQYISKRYGLTLAAGTFLITTRNGIVVVLLLIILPYISKMLMRVYGLCGQRKDLYLARASQTLIAIGFLGIATSPNVPTVAVSLAVASLGTGSTLYIRSFLTSLLPPRHIARAYGVVSMTTTAGIMFGYPLLAWLFTRGLALGGAWIGLPCYVLGLLSAFVAVLLFAVDLRKSEGDVT